jgi:hypothetical protein
LIKSLLFIFLVMISSICQSATSVEQKLLKASTEYNKQLPSVMDRDTRADTTSVGPGRKFTFWFSIVSKRAVDIDKVQFNQNISPGIRRGVCSDPALRNFFKDGVTLTYLYRGNDGVYITEINVTPRDCGY